MRAHSRVVASTGAGGRLSLREVRSCAPLLLRRAGDAVYLVGGAAGPLGGDDVVLEIVVERGAALTLRSAAAFVARPGTDGSASRMRILVQLEEGAALRWLPEPLIAAQGCEHRSEVEIDLAPGARMLWREELFAGRHGDTGGTVHSQLSVARAGTAVVRQELVVSPLGGIGGPAVLNGARVLACALVVHPALGSRATEDHPADARQGPGVFGLSSQGSVHWDGETGCVTGVWPLADPQALQITALGVSGPSVRAGLRDALGTVETDAGLRWEPLKHRS